MSTENYSHEGRIRWGWVSVAVLGGVSFIALALILESVYKWRGLTPSILVNVGVALGLAGVIFLLEQKFEGIVQRASTSAAQSAVRDVEERFQEQADQLSARLDDLQSGLTERMRAKTASQDQILTNMENNASFKNVWDSFQLAVGLNALSDNSVIVHANDRPEGTAVQFTLRNQKKDQSPAIEVSVPRLPGDNQGVAMQRVGFSLAQVEWEEDDDAITVGEKLVTALQSKGQWFGSETLNWSLTLQNLKRSIEVAVSSRRADPGAWRLSGALIEILDKDWVLTDAGVEAPSKGFLFPRSRLQEASAKELLEDEERPIWCAPEAWERVVYRGRRRFHRWV